MTCLFSADNDGEKFISATARFKRLFGMPDEEKLVNCMFFIYVFILSLIHI